MRRVSVIALALFSSLPVGCGGGSAAPSYGGDDGRQIASLVDEMNDESGSVARLKVRFAEGTPLTTKNVKAFTQFRYDVTGDPAVSGDTATAKVKIERHTGGAAGEQEWTFVKDGDKWKIKSAPLP